MSPDYLDIRLQGRRDKLLVWSEPHRQQKKPKCSEWYLYSNLRFGVE